MPWEPFRPWGLVSAEGIRLGPRPGWASCQGGRGRGAGWAGGQRLRGAGCWEGSTSGFCSLLWTSVKCGARWHVAWRGRGRSGARWLPGHRPTPTFRHFREKRMTASVSWTASSFPTVWTRLACPRGRQGAQGTLANGHACASVCVTLLQLSWSSPLGSPKKEQEINIPIRLSSKWSFAAKEKVIQTLQDLEVKPPGVLRGNGEKEQPFCVLRSTDRLRAGN